MSHHFSLLSARHLPWTISLLLPLFMVMQWKLPARAAENLIQNGGLEQPDESDRKLAAHWTEIHHQALPLQFSSVHYEGKLAALLEG